MITTEPSTFNGINLERINGSLIIIRQEDKIKNLDIPDTQKGFESHRAMDQYIGVNCRPDVCSPVQFIAPGSEPTTTVEYKTLEKVVKNLRTSKEDGLTYFKLDMEALRLLLVTDESFRNARGMKNQLGFFVMMADKSVNANIVHYGSIRCRRVTKSIMESEIRGLLLGFDFAYAIRDMLVEILGK